VDAVFTGARQWSHSKVPPRLRPLRLHQSARRRSAQRGDWILQALDLDGDVTEYVKIASVFPSTGTQFSHGVWQDQVRREFFQDLNSLSFSPVTLVFRRVHINNHAATFR
jgi:hypothetical protein